MSRYNRRRVAKNEHEMYTDQFESRDVSSIDQYTTPRFLYPTDEQSELISYFTHIWSPSDKYYLLAHRYYNDSSHWWIIAQYNKAPTEQHLTAGQEIKIPYPLSAVFNYLGQV